MSAFLPSKGSSIFPWILLLFASITIGWAFLTFLRPIIIEAGCSEIAQKSSSLVPSGESDDVSRYQYDNLKARCLQDALENY